MIDNFNLSEAYDEHMQTKFHQGFYQKAYYIWNIIKEEDKFHLDGTILYITGHSREASIGEALHVVEKYELKKNETFTYLSDNITSLLLSPQPSFLDVGACREGSPNMHIFINQNDIVPLLQYHTVKGCELHLFDLFCPKNPPDHQHPTPV
jgi:predicted lipase